MKTQNFKWNENKFRDIKHKETNILDQVEDVNFQTSTQQSGNLNQSFFVSQPQFAMPTNHGSNFSHNSIVNPFLYNRNTPLDTKIDKLASEEKDDLSIGGENSFPAKENSFPARENGYMEKTFSTIVPQETQVLRADGTEENSIRTSPFPSSNIASDIDAQKEFYLITKFTTEQFERLEQEFHKKNNPENYEIIQLANR